jgi:hypothetical protein
MHIVLDCVIGVPVYDPVEPNAYANDKGRPAQDVRFPSRLGGHLIRQIEGEALP